MEKVTCFISYCWDDIDRDILNFIKDYLVKHPDQKYEVLVDENLTVGSDIKEFMRLLDSVDVVILLLSPAYKRKLTNRQGGVYQEFPRIYARYEQIQELKQQGKRISEIEGYFELIPILLTGDWREAVPDEISHLKYLSLAGFRLMRDTHTGQSVVTRYAEQKYLPELEKIVEKLRFVSTNKSPELDTLFKNYYSRLFLELKADWKNPLHKDHRYVETLFVKTRVYRKVEEQTVYFLFGRKGSGKSTIAEVLAMRQGRKYAGLIQIVADRFDLEFFYSLFNQGQFKSDAKIISTLSCFQFTWEAFFHLCTMEILVNLSKDDQLTAYQTEIIEPIKSFLNNVLQFSGTPNTDNKRTFFTYSYTSVVRFVKDCIAKARSDEQFYYSDIHALFTRERFLEFTLGTDVCEAFNEILVTFRRRLLITLDEFDTAFDMFRTRGIENVKFSMDLDQRVDFEIDWLRSLLLLVIDIRQRPQKASVLYELMDFCITIPKDRFYELMEADRDSYRYLYRYSSLDWSGIELAILLRKRLEELGQISTDPKLKPEERLALVLKERFGHLPSQISLDFNNRTYTMPLFFYVLRHTFWRPREVLVYFAHLLATAENLRKTGKITSELIMRAVKEATSRVIETEFIGEFQSVLINIREVIKAFGGCKQFLSYEDLSSVVAGTGFHFASDKLKMVDTDGKIAFLYEIGFLGVVASPELRARYNLMHKHCFYFNEGPSLISAKAPQRFKQFTFIVHPVFSEYLQLDTSSNELVLEFTWEYLHDIEAIIGN